MFVFAFKALVMFLFVSLYSFVVHKKMLHGTFPLKKLILCILMGNVVANTLLNNQILIIWRASFLMFSILAFLLIVRFQYHHTEKLRH